MVLAEKLAHLVRRARRSVGGGEGSCERGGSGPTLRARDRRLRLLFRRAARRVRRLGRRIGHRPATRPPRGARPGRRRPGGQPGQRRTAPAGRHCVDAAGAGFGRARRGAGRADEPGATGAAGELRLRALLDLAAGADLRHHRAVDAGLLLHRREPQRHARRERSGLERLREPGPRRSDHPCARGRRAGRVDGDRLRTELARRPDIVAERAGHLCRQHSSPCCRRSRSTG